MPVVDDKGFRVVGGAYELLMRVGHGGMSDVWLGRDRRSGSFWAIKETTANPMVNRLAAVREGRMLRQLDHPAIPHLADVFEDGSAVFVVMDFVEGRSLERALRERDHEPFAWEEVARWGVQLSEALGYLHGRTPPVVYRDMKPGNVMLCTDGTVKLVDFGIAMELVAGRRDDGRLAGSPGYAAPEQLERDFRRVHSIDARSDIYALGATLYSAATGDVPRHVRQADGHERYELAVRPICEARPDIPREFEAVICRATMREPGDRYQTAGEMRSDLERLVRACG